MHEYSDVTDRGVTESSLRVERITVPYDEVLKTTCDILRDALPKDYVSPQSIDGFDSPAMLVAQSLVDGDAQGHPTHGIQRVIDYVEAIRSGRIDSYGKFTITKQSPAHAVCRGGGNFGQVASQLALQHALDAIGNQPTFTVTCTDMYHAGRLEWYLRQAARQGYGGFGMLNVGGAGRAAPFPDGLESRYGTNPIAIAVPDGGDGVIVDFATTAVTEGFVNVHRINEQALPTTGLLQTHDGQSTVNPHVLYDAPVGTLLPMAKHKGSGLAQVIKMLVSQTTGRVLEENQKPKTNEIFLCLTNVAQFRDEAAAFAAVHETRDHIKSCRTKSGHPVLMPGEGGLERAQLARENGIPLYRKTWEEVLALRDP